MKISIASDHSGFDLKAFLVGQLRESGYDLHDHGAHELIPGDDYPEYIAKVAQDVSRYEESLLSGAESLATHDVHGKPHRTHVGIVIGGTGQGEAMAANKFPYVRAAVLYGGVMAGGSETLIEKIATLSREHNDANILSLGARFLTEEEALSVVKLWLRTEFSEDTRHQRRIDQIKDIETEIKN